MVYEELAQIIRHGSARQAQDAQARYARDHGVAATEKALEQIHAEIRREHLAAETAVRLGVHVAQAAGHIATALGALGELRDPHRAWHLEYAGTSIGEDLAKVLSDAAFSLRVAAAVNSAALTEAP